MKESIKASLALKGKKLSDLAAHLGISKQALSNKLFRDSFSGEDLLKISNFLGCKLAFVDEENTIFIT